MARLTRALLGSVVLLAACRSFEFEREQVFLRYTPETDVLDAVLVYQGVAPKKNDEDGQKVLDELGAGRRHFVFLDWPMDVDLDKAVLELDPKDELQRRFLTYQQGIRVLEARFLVDEAGLVCLLQRIQVRDAAAGLRLLDAVTNRLVFEELARSSDELSSDLRTREQLKRRAESSGSWVHFEGASVVVSIPMSPEEAAKNLSQLAAVDSDEDRAWWKSLLGAVTAVQLDADGLRVTAAPADGWIALAFDDPKYEATELAENVPLPDGMTRTELAPEIARFKSLR